MRITSSSIGMESARYYSTYTAEKTSAVVMVGTKGLLAKPQSDSTSSGNDMSANVPHENRKMSLREKLNEMSSYSEVSQIPHLQNERDVFSTVRDRCMQFLMQIFFGETKSVGLEEILSKASAAQSFSGGAVLQTTYYHEEISVTEQENTSFSTVGTVKTADGREIGFNLNVEMSRSFSAYYEAEYSHIQARMSDPLVINLNTDAAELTGQTFFFDIDADGVKDRISTLGKGSGYLALDKNRDGIINDGSELFGSKSGDGFADLAAFDSDGNGWIDENDEIWKKLLIWTKDENGQDKCYRLSEKGIGAICLVNSVTDFALNSVDNIPNGRIRKTGIFLYENGCAGTIQHLDIAKHDNYA